MKTFVAVALSAAASCVATVGVLTLYAVIQPRPRATLPFSVMLDLVDEGRVRDIHVRGQLYTFDGKETIGPRATASELATLRPRDPTIAAPKVVVE